MHKNLTNLTRVRGRFGRLDYDHDRAQKYPEVVMVGLSGDGWRQSVPHDRGRHHEASLPGHDTGVWDMMLGRSTARDHSCFSFGNEKLGWDSHCLLLDVMHHEQSCMSTTLLEWFPFEIVFHLCDTGAAFPLTCHIPGTFCLASLKCVTLVLHVGTGVRIPDSRCVFQFRSYVGRVRRSLGLDVTGWEVALEELPSARCVFTNFAYMRVETKF